MVTVTFHGHACFCITGEKHRVIIDPWLTGNPQADMKVEEVQNIDAVLVTHGHADHLGDAVEISKKCDAIVVAPYELATFCERRGAKVHPMHIGGARRFEFGWVKLTQALHGSAVVDGGGTHYTGNPCGFLLEMDGRVIYHAGDTGLFGDMRILSETLPNGKKIDVALLPIGDNFVMGPEDAFTAARWIQPHIVVPMHYNTFPVIEQDPYQFKERVEKELGLECRVLKPGEGFDL
ncbi:metal-dependent hydrolase [Calderihabitans maritimus]|uniref:UPF0173 metal-dependent hydrolase KKC1_34990 n=1 Tax=Calderihabitans maritimus TaxID=1246530 RepID=A0A1Z5HY13_9FIRM|nr:metal-dependent hydrolase [Calderihabitans maritimus]GAW94394.1 metal-dependent hydrolase [Calderihabitans maritimus]